MIQGLHIEPTNICTLKCPGCARTRFINQWPGHWKNQNLDIDAVVKFIDIDIKDLSIMLCGNYGDPIYHPRFIDLVTVLKDRDARLQIVTNGSYRSSDWWESIVDVLDENDSVKFSVDGTPENFTTYRVNGDWDSIKIGMDICVSGRPKTIWKYIPFQFNQDDIESTRSLSREIGIDEFQVEFSDRFDGKTEHLMPVSDLLGSRKSFQDSWKQGNSIIVNPKCQSLDQHFISASGHYSPCCFVADHRFYYKTPFGRDRSFYDIKSLRLSQILNRPDVIDFYKTIPKNPPRVCQYSCPATG